MPQMKNHRVCRVLLYPWLFAVAFWAFLPAPPISDERIDKTLRAGQPLTVYGDTLSMFNDDNGGVGGHVILQWRLSKHRNEHNEQELLLSIGENTPIYLASLMKRSENFHVAKENSERMRTPFFDTRKWEVDVDWVDRVDCAAICLPWMHRNEKVLLTHALHGGTKKSILNLLVNERGAVEAWPSTMVQSTLTELERVRQKPEAREYSEAQLLEEALQYLRRSGHPLIQLDGGNMTKTEDITVLRIRGNLPTRTYPIRRAMIKHLGPVLSIALLPLRIVVAVVTLPSTLAGLLFLQGGLACAGIMLSCWLRDGRPPFWRWTRRFWMTWWVYGREKERKRVWGPAGPVGEGVVLQRPKTVRFGQHWDAV